MTLFKALSIAALVTAPLVGAASALLVWWLVMCHLVAPIAAALQALANTL